ncbi:hypothetical protein LXM50_06395 [Microbacterium sp. Au-Mic1]|uniref:type IV toxin-antitoxin system AbiEi family antitoxin domain-containing protein n=1 Tax=Microbacterium sp. Au-Mic1 TaxID=2906457 RepID=UPI001E4A5C1B|nr:hypothetical protein [Microbacterium sp. Au-Mic1]MCE4025598.1 hypothetical protein [Microbacterium sp. Au-Mic1]
MALLIPAVHHVSELGRIRRTASGVYRADDRGELERIRPGVYAPRQDWATASPEGRVIARAHALGLVSDDAVFSHETAAALHGLPLFRPDRTRVHLTVSDDRPGSAVGTVRHRGAISEEEVVEVRGLRCTTLERTVADVARTASFESAVVVADAALRSRCASASGTYDEDAAAALLEAVHSVAHRSAQGRHRADRVVAFADGRAQLPGESISRIRLVELGFRRIRLQVEVPGPYGSYFVDFALDDPSAVAFGEFDGAIKYSDAGMLAGRSGAEVLDREKQREDWIRGSTQRPFARWGWTHIDSAIVLGRRLAAFGIRPA